MPQSPEASRANTTVAPFLSCPSTILSAAVEGVWFCCPNKADARTRAARLTWLSWFLQRNLLEVAAFAVIFDRAGMHRDHLADRNGSRIVIPRLELDLEQIAVFVESLGDIIGKGVRHFVADIDEVIWPHHSGNRAIDAAE